jgi:hypothetical protein
MIVGMIHSLRHKILIFLLGLFVTLGMGLSVVHSNIMIVDVAMSDGMGKMDAMGSNSKGPCNDCLDGKNMTKGMVCVAGCLATVPLEQTTTDHAEAALLIVEPSLYVGLPKSRDYPPDPYPPRPFDLA